MKKVYFFSIPDLIKIINKMTSIYDVVFIRKEKKTKKVGNFKKRRD